MFDHIKFGVTDYAASKAFFLKALEPLGVTVLAEGPPAYGIELGRTDGASDEPTLILYQTEESPAPLHLAFAAESRRQVDAFHRAALEAGATDNGPPGLRTNYSSGYYAAFVLGPDGHNIEVVCHELRGPFYHGTKADLRPGDLIAPGYRSNYGPGQRTTRWVYMTATLSPLGAELARGDGPGRLYIVEPTGPFEDDPDLTDKKFAGNPTRSYRSREPLRVVGEVTDWEPTPPERIKAMLDAQDRIYAQQAARMEHIPGAADFDQVRARADELARAWAPDAAYVGGTLLMFIRGVDVEVFSATTYRSEARGETRAVELPRPSDVQPGWTEGDITLSGRITDVTAWREGWEAVIESCITEIGLSLETRLWVAADADHDTLVFRVDADGPERSWRRDLRLVRGVLSDDEHGEIWDFGPAAPRHPEGGGSRE